MARLGRQEGLNGPKRQPKRSRRWPTDGSCLRLRPEHPNPGWAYDLLTDRTHAGRAFRLLTIVDEVPWECLAIVMARQLPAEDGLATLTALFITRGGPGHLRSVNGPEFGAKIVREWLAWLDGRTLVLEPGSP